MLLFVSGPNKNIHTLTLFYVQISKELHTIYRVCEQALANAVPLSTANRPAFIKTVINFRL